MFSKVLVANRGEIAVRIIATLRRMGIASVAVHSDADRFTQAVRLADEAVRLGPAPASQSYLDIDAVIAACRASGAEAVHPGYGFLSENIGFAERLAAEGIAFIGPTPANIAAFGLKHTARELARSSGVPLLPGSDLLGDLDAALSAAETIGYPVMLKSTAGGGGIGMSLCADAAALEAAFAGVQRTANASFGDARVFLERYVADARHVEVQIFGDGKGRVIALGERDCSLQRRNQKVWEEAGGPTISPQERDKIGEICAVAMRKLGYSGVGTVEFLYEDGEFYFIEMNTRLQVEHPVTERITGIDIVYEQIRVASGEKLSMTQDKVTFTGHAIEVRINAEDPQTFAPSPGTITFYHPAGGVGIRVDSAVYQGYKIPPYYDSLIGKLIVYGRTRDECLQRLRRAIDEFVIDGIKTTLPLFQRLIKEPEILSGNYDIHWLEKYLDENKV